MNRNEQQMYKDISDLTKAVQKLVKLLTDILWTLKKIKKDKVVRAKRFNR